MRISKKTAGILVFVAGFLILNIIFEFALRPYSSSGAEMWRGFFAKENIDCIYIGSSQCLCDIDPETVDKKTGMTSYNMGTNMQSVASSYKCVSTAIKEKNIKSVVLVLDPEIMESDRKENSRVEACFYRSLSDNLPLSKRVSNNLEFLTDRDFLTGPYSVTYFIPWTYDRVGNPVLNIREKLAGEILSDDEHRDENGWETTDDVYTTDERFVRFGEAKKWSDEYDDLKVLEPSAENLETLENIAKLCSEKKVELITVTAPHTGEFAIYDYDSYKAFCDNTSEMLDKYGFTYCNFNLIKEEYFDILELDLYKDNSHLNKTGARIFSEMLGDHINALKNGQDLSYMFYNL